MRALVSCCRALLLLPLVVGSVARAEAPPVSPDPETDGPAGSGHVEEATDPAPADPEEDLPPPLEGETEQRAPPAPADPEANLPPPPEGETEKTPGDIAPPDDVDREDAKGPLGPEPEVDSDDWEEDEASEYPEGPVRRHGRRRQPVRGAPNKVISPGAALGWSLGATLAGIGGGLGLAFLGDTSGDNDTLIFLGWIVVVAGVHIGPSLGLMAAGAHGRAWGQFGIRAGFSGLGTVLLLLAALGSSASDAEALIFASAACFAGTVGMAIFSIIDAPLTARRRRRALEQDRAPRRLEDEDEDEALWDEYYDDYYYDDGDQARRDAPDATPPLSLVPFVLPKGGGVLLSVPW